ncbi:hypothetical protein K470DRAFT_273415 [Piedraia hortae CBS 480.64]|uniref:Ribosomal protein S5 domain 2-like protein n=1 Tax=Piedraia hortae CBS 480.64 TaxID=1314780 RepID=A0A6A7BPL0_9PEZI|nr:hypothetical protein K470DRAFT_273415 [Piedraia hortae CBS 480.64]
MPREQSPSTNERSFVRKALRDNARLDGRRLSEYRAISLLFPSPDAAEVRLGKTRVLCSVSCEIVTPPQNRKFDGIFTIVAELGPGTSPAFDTGGSRQELLLARTLEKTVRRSGALDTESLCIIAGEKCFHVRADVHVMDHDGNLIDASCLAVVAALSRFRRPNVEVRGGVATVYSAREREPVKLALHHRPFCVTTSYYEGISFQDANLLEEHCRDGEVIVSLNKFGEVCGIAKYGGVAVDALIMLQMIKDSLERVKALDMLVADALKESEERPIAELSAENER